MATLTSQQLKNSYQSLVTIGDSITSDPTSGQLENGKGTPLTAVGIGTNTPSATLEINGGVGKVFTIDQGTSNKTQLKNDRGIELIGQGGYPAVIKGLGNAGFGHIVFETSNNGEVARIDSSGRVGIGTASPDSNLVVNGSSNVRINLKASDVRYGTIFADSGIVAVSSIVSIPLVLGTNDTERMRIDSSGNVGIGNTPTARLQVGTGADALTGTGTGQICISGAGQTIAVTDKPAVYHRNGVGLGLYSDAHMSFEVNGSTSKYEAMRILSSGGLTFNGDTATANALDDYEEGTWTPTIEGSTSNPTVTYAASNTGGIYTKIGNKVTVSFEVRWTALSGGSGNVLVEGLPFVRRNTDLPDGDRAIIDSYNNTISGKYLIGAAGKNSTLVDFTMVNSAAATTTLIISDLPTSSLGFLRGTITYFV